MNVVNVAHAVAQVQQPLIGATDAIHLLGLTMGAAIILLVGAWLIAEIRGGKR